VKFDLRKFEMLGNVERGMSVIMLREEALPRLTDLSAEPVPHGTTGKPNQDIILVLGQEYLGWNLKWVVGYPSSADIYLAFEQGELDTIASGTSEIIDRYLKAGMVPVVAGGPRPDYPEVPLLLDLAGDKVSEVDKNLFSFLGSSVDKFGFMPPGTPKDRVDIVAEAFLKVSQDPEFQKLATSFFGGGWYFDGPEETMRKVEATVVLSPEIENRMNELAEKYGVPFVVQGGR
jgi:hypothetical protein